MQVFLGTCLEACGAGSGCSRQGSGAESSIRGGGGRGEARYAKLLAEAVTVDTPPVVSPQLTELQERIKALVLERDALRAAPLICGIPQEAQGMDGRPTEWDLDQSDKSDSESASGADQVSCQ